jgi:hypothetical protein
VKEQNKPQNVQIDQLAYALKHNCRPLFRIIEVVSGFLLASIHRKRISSALSVAKVEGSIKGSKAFIRPLKIGDLDMLMSFFDALPVEHFAYFRPHGFTKREVEKVLRRPYYLAYGLFCEGNLVGYSLFKLYPGKKAFFGRILSPNLTGLGVGKFLSLYLQWQSRLLGFSMRGTINLRNSPSVGSHKAVGGFEILGDLPNGYTLIEFSSDRMPTEAPSLDL